MTLFGWDASHYDGRLTPTIMAKAKTEGVVFFTHKVGEGTGGDDAEDATALAAARDAGIEFIGGYHVVRSGPISPQVDAALYLADRDEPWWRRFPGWFWQVDLERWSYDSVSASTGIAFARELRQRTGRTVVLYASRGQYGDNLTGWDGPLWNAKYGTNPIGSLRGTYPGDDSAGWLAYSGQTPTFLQYGSRVTIAGLTTCDANAFRGTLAELRALIIGDDMAYTDAQMQAFPWQYDGRGIGENNGTTVQRSMLSYVDEILLLTRKIAGAVPPDLVKRLDAILAAAQDDGNTTVVLDPAALADLQAIKAAITAVPKAVLDAEAARLES